MHDEESKRGLGPRGWGIVAAVWAAAALAWTPAAYLAEGPARLEAFAIAGVFLRMLIHFAPWALATPLFVGLSRLFPFGLGRTGRVVLVFALLGSLLIPSFTALGVAAGRLLGAAFGAAPPNLWGGFGRATLITALFALPTYVAMVAIGQTAAWLERYRERERLLSQARAAALRAQIGPHFLFNALNAISALGYSDPAQADRALVRLAAILRETLDRPEWTSLRDEVALIADYVELHRLLLGDRLSFELRIAPEAWDARVPAMLLQPLVENSLVHGLSRLPAGGTLSLAAAAPDGGLLIEITNDAPPADGPPGDGIGLANVRRRIEAVWGSRGRLEFDRSHGRARVVLIVPLEPAP